MRNTNQLSLTLNYNKPWLQNPINFESRYIFSKYIIEYTTQRESSLTHVEMYTFAALILT
jgi:hypothetical protein